MSKTYKALNDIYVYPNCTDIPFIPKGAILEHLDDYGDGSLVVGYKDEAWAIESEDVEIKED